MDQQKQNYISEANAFIKKKRVERKFIMVLLFVSLGLFLLLFTLSMLPEDIDLGITTSILLWASILAPGIALIPGFLRFAWAVLRGMPASLKDKVPTYTAYVDESGNVQVQRDYHIGRKILQVFFSFWLLALIGLLYFFCSIIIALIKFFRLKKIINETASEIHSLGGEVIA